MSRIVKCPIFRWRSDSHYLGFILIHCTFTRTVVWVSGFSNLRWQGRENKKETKKECLFFRPFSASLLLPRGRPDTQVTRTGKRRVLVRQKKNDVCLTVSICRNPASKRAGSYGHSEDSFSKDHKAWRYRWVKYSRRGKTYNHKRLLHSGWTHYTRPVPAKTATY